MFGDLWTQYKTIFGLTYETAQGVNGMSHIKIIHLSRTPNPVNRFMFEKQSGVRKQLHSCF